MSHVPLLYSSWHAQLTKSNDTWPQGGDQLANGSSASLAPEAGQLPIQAAAHVTDARAPTGQPGPLLQPAAVLLIPAQGTAAAQWAANAHLAPSGASPWVCRFVLGVRTLVVEQFSLVLLGPAAGCWCIPVKAAPATRVLACRREAKQDLLLRNLHGKATLQHTTQGEPRRRGMQCSSRCTGSA